MNIIEEQKIVCEHCKEEIVSGVYYKVGWETILCDGCYEHLVERAS